MYQAHIDMVRKRFEAGDAAMKSLQPVLHDLQRDRRRLLDENFALQKFNVEQTTRLEKCKAFDFFFLINKLKLNKIKQTNK